MATTTEQQVATKKKSPVRLIILIVVAIVGIIYAYKKISYSLSHENTDDAQVSTQITPVLPRVTGYIKKVYVNDYDSVKAGQLVAEIDDADIQSDLAEMEANLAVAKADMENARAGVNNAQVSIDPSQGNIDLNQVKLKQAQEDYQRNSNLFNDQAITKKQLDDSRFALQAIEQQVRNSHGDLRTVRSRVDIMQAGIAKAEAAIKVEEAKIAQQKLKLTYTKIYAPVTGKIGKNNIAVGQFVQAGTPLFAIVNDTTFWVVANFKETQIRKFYPGMEVEIKLDAYPDQELTGKLSSVSRATGAQFALLPPDNASGNFVKVTQRIPVKIDIVDVQKHSNILKAGMSADVTVPVK